MRFSEHWLRTMVNPPLDTTALCERLTMAGLEVEHVAPAAPPCSGVVVARIEAVRAHPDADRLRVCTVDAGTGVALQIVCGAPNAVAGMKVPCALAGASLPGAVAIRATTVRGVASSGMLCSAGELGIDDDTSGLLRLAEDAVVGTDIRSALRLDDSVITLKLTPNRADCLSMLGLAREVAAITGSPLTPPPCSAVRETSRARRPVRVETAEGCPRFTSRTIEGIDPSAPTPDWMKQRLQRGGIRSISAVVDITNYVMLERGQPLHAYDDRLLDGDIVVRFAAEGEELVLLNGQVQRLETDQLLVCDERKPLGLAGIMGGEHSGIGASTTTVFLEAAYWNPAIIQGKSRRLGFVSDAGYRFERGVDFEGCAHALERATELILACCGGRAGPADDIRGPLPDRSPVRVRPARVARLLGIDLSPVDITSLLDRLGLAYVRDRDALLVTPPSYRFDLAIEEDFVEEVARLHGYDAIPAIPAAHVQDMLPAPECRRTASSLKRALVARDWQEAITFSFVSSATEAALFPDRPAEAAPLAVLNPIASHLDVMRTTLAGGLIEALRTNLARRAERVRIFEAGRCFVRTAPGCEQPLRLGGLAYGDALGEQWGHPARPVDFFDVKADLEALIAPLPLRTAAERHPALHPGRSARAWTGARDLGWIGELHPRLVEHFDLPRAPVLFELDLAALMTVPLPAARAVSRLPEVRRDLAIVVDEKLPAQSLVDALAEARVANVEAVRLFDVYRGSGLPPGTKSLAILVLMQDTERTLTDPDIDAILTQLVRIVAERFGGSLRQ